MTQGPFVKSGGGTQHKIFPGVDVFTVAGKEMMLSRAVFEPNAIVERHSHPHEQVGMVIRGSALFEVGEEQQTLEVGDMYVIPGGVPHRVTATDSGCEALDIFHPIREDYL